MYLPKQFEVPAGDAAAALSRGGFAHLVTPVPDGGLEVTSLPLLYDADNHALIGHLARPNPQWRYTGEAESVAIIPGVDAYVTPSYYPSKQDGGKTVPTWNYETLTVHGRLRAHDDPEWLLDHVTRLTDRHETGRAQPWRVTDAPEPFVRAQLRAIVGIELVISRVVAKAKLSQNRTAPDRAGVVRGLAGGSRPEQETAARMAGLGLDRG
ncbi:PaiB family negative transcriptional regulator [Amycolatopsis sulphurea]|uniref:PaiB family negative transcriptional regulator n=1 Tax=Amycolatopsis sulphurea TaxID=76022 RepID=A0A2A9FGW4_9PSEU|nr:FMN-binding negative transcriptional regulator [Amycolatopsis sulphurea]PFG50604.1 PaiB family negative transcriptional regulator [Amycolatopsis sulphurea]